MKKCITYSLLLALSLNFSCKKEDAAPTNFEIDVSSDFLQGGLEGWVIFHDSDGKVLDAKQLTAGQNYKFNDLKTSDGKIGVTIATLFSKQARLESYLMVSTPAKWTLSPEKSESVGCNSSPQSLDIRIQDPNLSTNPLDYSLSDRLLVNNQPPYNAVVGSYVDFQTYQMTPGCFDDFFIYALDKNGVPHYKFLENIQPGKYTYSFNDFSLFDQTLKFDFPQSDQNFLQISGVDTGPTGENFIINFSQTPGNISRSTMTAGYLNRFTKYKTVFGTSYYVYGMKYIEVGAIPTSISLPLTFSPQVTDDKFETLAVTANEDFIYSNSLFYNNVTSSSDVYIQWSVYVNKDNTAKNIQTMPQAFLTKYPGFHKETLIHNSTEFFTQNFSLNDLEAQRFQGAAIPATYKQVSKTIF